MYQEVHGTGNTQPQYNIRVPSVYACEWLDDHRKLPTLLAKSRHRPTRRSDSAGQALAQRTVTVVLYLCGDSAMANNDQSIVTGLFPDRASAERASIRAVQAKGRDLMTAIGDCGDEYRR